MTHLVHMTVAASAPAALSPMTHPGATAHACALLVEGFFLLIRQQAADLVPVSQAFFLDISSGFGQFVDLGLEAFLVGFLDHHLAKLKLLGFQGSLQRQERLLMLKHELLHLGGLLWCQVGNAAGFLAWPRVFFLRQQRENEDKGQPNERGDR